MGEPAYCPFKGRCAHPECLEDIDQCASALMAQGLRTPLPTIPVRRPRKVSTTPGETSPAR